MTKKEQMKNLKKEIKEYRASLVAIRKKLNEACRTRNKQNINEYVAVLIVHLSRGKKLYSKQSKLEAALESNR
ncbi:MAG: hypothetical protein HZC28_19535 [Spirochaetes bacterium]|nr:hypothetical protein [Spirochaetota bacterium]